MLSRSLPYLLFALVLLASPLVSQEDLRGLKSSDLKKMTKATSNWVESRLKYTTGGRQSDYQKQASAREDLEKAYRSAQKKMKDREVLSLVGDWTEVLEASRPYLRKGYLKGKTDQIDVGSNGFFFSSPKSYNPKKASIPLVLLLAEPGTSPEEAVLALDPAWTEAALILCPDFGSLSIEDWTSLNAGLSQSVFPALGHVFRDYRVDRNRVVLYAQGAAILPASKLATNLPYWFSCLLAEGAPPISSANLSLLPIAVQGGSTAPGQDSLGSPADAAGWALSQIRNPYPTEFEVELGERWAGRMYWIQALKFDDAASSEDNQPARLKVRIDRATNTIHVDTERVFEVSIYMNDHLLDLGKPIHINRNGVVYDIQLNRSIDTMLENFFNSNDPNAISPAVIRSLSIPSQEKRD